MRNPPKRKRLGDEDIKSTFSLTSLRELERQLGDAMSQAGIVKMERERKGRPNGRGVNKGSSGTMIYSLGSGYNRDLLKATLLKKSFSEVSASQIIKDSFVKFQRKLNADKLRSIYDEIKDIPRAKLDSYNLNLLCELKNVFLEIDRDEERSRKNAPRPQTAGEREAQLFEKHNESLSAQKTRRELNERKPEERKNKRQKTSEDWRGGLNTFFASATDTLLSSSASFLVNFGISFPKPEEQKKLVAVRDPMEEKEAEIYKPDSFKPSLKEIEDRPYTFLNRLKGQSQLESSKFSTVSRIESSNYLLERIKLWNEQLNKFNSVPSPQEYHDGDFKGYAGDYQKCILEYQKYLQASIKKIKTSNSEQGKILSGFLYLELAKVEHMVTGENAYVDDKGSFSTREARNYLYSTEGLGVMDSMPKFAKKFSSSREYPGDKVTPPYYQSLQPSNSEGLRKIRNRLYNKIPARSQIAIYYAQIVVSKDDNFVDTINVPRTVNTSDDFKLKFSEERTKFWNPPKIGDTSKPRAKIAITSQVPAPSPSPSLEKRSLIKEAQSVKDKINGNYTGVGNLQRIVDSPIDFSKDIFEVTSKIDIAIGVMKPKSSKFDFERHQQEGDLVKFLKDSKSLLNIGDAVRGRSGGLDRRRENIYAYVEFLDYRIKILQDVVNDLKSSNPSQDMSIKKLKEMQANLGLELVRISDSFTPQEDLIGQFQAPHRVSRKNTGLDPLGPVHHGDSLKTLRAEEMKKKLGPTFVSMLDDNRFEARKSFAYSDKKVAPANQDFLKLKVDEALINLNGIRRENREGGKGGGR